MKRSKVAARKVPVTTKNSWYHFHNKKNGEVRIDVMEDIGGWGVSAKQFRSDLKHLGPKEAIHLHINSDGGDIIQGNEIYNALMEHDGPIRVSIGALAASMASVIAMVGDPISIAKNGWVMVHDPFTLAMGNAGEFRKMADVMDGMKANIIEAYRSQSDLSEAEISDLMSEETWMSAEDALEKGFVDSIDGDDASETDTAVNFNLTKFRNSAKFLSKPKPEQAPASGNTPVAMTTGNSGAPSGQEEPTNKPKQILVLNHMGKPNENPEPPDKPEVDEAEVKRRADELYKAKLKRDLEIDEIVLSVRKRDKKDFGELAAKFKQDDKSVAEFSRALVTSEEYKPFGEIIGSGPQVSEPLDAIRGSPGWIVVTDPQYKAMAERVQRLGRGAIPKQSAALVEMQYGVREFLNALQRQFMGAAALPTSAGLTSIEKQPGIVTLGVRPLMVKDLLAPGATTATTIRYIREKSFTNTAATVAEGAAKPQALFEYEEKDAPVRKIAVFTKVTDELFADYMAMASYINQRLVYMVEQTEDNQLLNGDGTGTNLTGLLQTSGIQTQAKGADTNPDALYKAMTKVRTVGFFEPDGVVINPGDFQILRLSKDTAGQYLGGGPFTGAYGNSPLVMFDSIWGKPCAITAAIAAGTALVGAFRLGAQYFQRQGVTVDMTNSDQDDFIKNLMTIRVEERLALAVYRPLAFCTVTGIV